MTGVLWWAGLTFALVGALRRVAATGVALLAINAAVTIAGS